MASSSYSSPLSHSTSSAWRRPAYQSSHNSTHGPYANANEIHVPKIKTLNRPQPLRSMTSAPSGYVSRHGKLHKRSDSGSSLILPTSPMSSVPKYDVPCRTASATKRIKPYLRKMSMRDDDEEQGRLDLSRPSVDYETYQEDDEQVSGLAVRDFSPAPHSHSHSASDVTFVPAARRRTLHRRATSLNSPPLINDQVQSTQLFIQTTRKPSNIYTPPSAFSATFPHSEDEVDESADILADDLHRNSIERWRSRRTTSIGSAPYGTHPSHISSGSAASLTKLTNASQSNLSTRSVSSNGTAPADQKAGRSRGNTNKSFEQGPTASSRTSIDRAVSFLSRTSNTEPEDPTARAANIRALRRAFEEKEAAKERKLEKVEMKRRDTVELKRQKKEEKQSRKSSVSEKSRGRRSTNTLPETVPLSEKAVAGVEYSRYKPVHQLSLPIQGGQGGESTETRVKTEVSKTKAAKGVWMRFRAWSKTRMLSCY